MSRRNHSTNSMKAWNAEDAWIAFNQGGGNGRSERIGHDLGRSRYGVDGIRTAISTALKHPSIDQAREALENRYHFSKQSVDAVLEVWRRVKFGSGIVQGFEEKPLAQPTSSSSSLDQAIDRVDSLFNQLKEATVDLAYQSAVLRTEELLKDKEAEITALKTVVEASKSSNLAYNLKDRLLRG